MRRLIACIDRAYWGTGIADDVPALTYYLVVSLVPFALGLAALATMLMGDALEPRQVIDDFARYLPEALHQPVYELVSNAKRQSPMLLAGAVLTMMWTTSGAIGVVERCLSRLLEAPRYPRTLGKLRNIALGGLLALLVVCSAAGASYASGLAEQLGMQQPPLARYLSTLASFLGVVVFCALIYKLAPKGKVSWVAAWLGAIPAGVILQLAPILIGAYLSLGFGVALGHVFLLVMVIIGACFLIAQGLLIGGGCAAWVERRQRRHPSS